jgi:hypothetical protein
VTSARLRVLVSMCSRMGARAAANSWSTYWLSVTVLSMGAGV